MTWGEAKDLIEGAASDTSTELGAELAGWAYPASTFDLLGLAAKVGNVKAFRAITPWTMKLPKPQDAASPDEVATATAELEDGIVFA